MSGIFNISSNLDIFIYKNVGNRICVCVMCAIKITCFNGLIVSQSNGKCAGNATGSLVAASSKANECVASLSIALCDMCVVAYVSVFAGGKSKINK